MRSLFFFFSSRRRHTRCSRDWSSDVCSSDLVPAQLPAAGSRSGTVVDRGRADRARSEEHTSELQSRLHLVCRLLLEKKKNAGLAFLLAVVGLYGTACHALSLPTTPHCLATLL